MEEGNHDTNFAFPITQKLENDRVRLVPWNVGSTALDTCLERC